MPDSIAIHPTHPVQGSIRPPGSKSITNRGLVCAALADGKSKLTGVLDSEDTRVMVTALEQLGVGISANWDECVVEVEGCGGGIPAEAADLYIANSGTSVRFLVSMLSLGHGRYRLDGTPRMRERPIQDLLDGLAQLGVEAQSEAGSGCPPVVITGNGWQQTECEVKGDVSSQFLSGLLMAAPYGGREHVELRVAGQLVSVPYVEMTLAVMSHFGGEVVTDHDPSGVPQRFRVTCRPYAGREYAIEPDASAASYFFAVAAITGGEVTVEGLSRSSLQGDVAFADALQRMGCEVHWHSDFVTVRGKPLHGIAIDMNPISDTVMTLAAVALFAEGPTTISGVGHIRHKETDRIAALATELRKLGGKVEEREDGLRITPAPLRGAALDTYDDHRMAMSLALVGLRVSGVVINDPGCTAKTYPRFFDDLDRLTSPFRK